MRHYSRVPGPTRHPVGISALVALASHKGIEMPISAAVAAVLADALTVDAAIEALLMRPFRAEG